MTPNEMAFNGEGAAGAKQAGMDSAALPENNTTTNTQTPSQNAESTPAQIDAGQSSPAPAENLNGKSPTPTRPPYNPQFSTATQLILSRIKNKSNTTSSTGSGPSSPSPSLSTAQLPSPAKAVYEDAKRRLVAQLRATPTLPMPTAVPASSPQPASPQLASPSVPTLSQPRSTSSPSIGTKRKRAAGDEDARPNPHPPRPSEPRLNLRPAPKPPAKRKRVKGDGNGQPMCVKCKRISWTEANLIIPCACGEAWHQLCHEPEILEGTARKHGGASFKCATCVKEEKDHAEYQRELAKWREEKQEQAGLKKQQMEVAKMREKRLASLPMFIKPGIVGFEAGNASSEARLEYFSGLKRTDLLNLLSFSDQIQPGLLVDILVSVTKKHPDLPIFNLPDWAVPKTQHSVSPQANAGQNGTASNHLAPPKPSKQRSKTGGVRKILKTAPVEVVKSVAVANDVEDEEEEDDDFLPSSWPKAGHGLYARLPPEKDDTKFLVDDNDEEAFSHFMVDKHGKQIMEPIKG